MDEPGTKSEIDERVRRLIRPNKEAVQRVLVGALRGQTVHRPRPTRWAAGIAVVGAMGLLGAGVWVRFGRAPQSPEVSPLVITGNAGFVVAERADGRRVVVVASTTDRMAAGSYIIVVER